METKRTLKEQLEILREQLEKTEYTAHFEISPDIKIMQKFKVLSDLDAIKIAKRHARENKIKLKSIYKTTEKGTVKL